MKADEFMRQAHIYKLGELTTEKPHSLSVRLAELARSDLPKAIEICRDIDLQALRTLISYTDQIDELSEAIEQTLRAGDRVFFCGCGATGRLSMTVEYLWRKENPKSEQVRAFMAGGDIALVHSLEGFEDYPELGERHARQLGFSEKDLMIGITEGGETPFVIGATEFAARHSRRRPFFIYCNPTRDLTPIERSRQVLDNQAINKIELYVGPMTLAGSTRMQASTVLQLALAKALFQYRGAAELQSFYEHLAGLDFSPLGQFTRREAEIYQAGDYLLYVPHEFAITTFTDTTERSPTFSLPPFENPELADKKPSLSYIMIPEAESKGEAWHRLLHREPTALNWGELDYRTENHYLGGFDFSRHVEDYRARKIGQSKQIKFVIEHLGNEILWQLEDLKWSIDIHGLKPVYQHTLLKILLNTHSTLLMGILGRYHSNIMTWVTPTNGKLVDRAARNVSYLLRQSQLSFSYDRIVSKIFEVMQNNPQHKPVVISTFEALTSERSKNAARET